MIRGHFCMLGVRKVMLRSLKKIVMSDRLNELKSIGVRYFRLEFTDESADMVKNIIRLYKTGEKCDFDFTRGHYYRGV